MEDEIFPYIPADLIEALDRIFPEKTPPLSMSLDEIRFKSGQRSVVQFLKTKHEEQTESVLNRKVLHDVSS